jgi:AraC-like DNA-binding protein
MQRAKNLGQRWSGYSPQPNVLHSSHPLLWRGAEFQEVAHAPCGSFDLAGSDWGLSWIQTPTRMRIAGTRAFEDISEHPTLFPMRPLRGEWIGEGSSIALFIDSDFVQEAFRERVDRASLESLRSNSSQIEYLINVLRADVIARSPIGPALGEFVIVQILEHIFPSSDSETIVKIDRVVERIQADLSKPLSLLDLAASADMSVRHLCRAFRAAIGCAPHQFILRSRVQRAKELLQKGDRSLIEVAEDVGFSSQAHMATAFRKLTGHTPSDFRIPRGKKTGS